MRKLAFLFSIVGWLAAASVGQTADQIVKWSISVTPQHTLHPGQKFDAAVSASIQSGWHVYATTQSTGGPTAAKVTVPDGQPFQMAGPVQSAKPQRKYDPNFEMNTEFFEGSMKLGIPVRVTPSAGARAQQLHINIKFQTCNETTCLPPTTVKLETSVQISKTPSKAGAGESGNARGQSGPLEPSGGPVQAQLRPVSLTRLVTVTADDVGSNSQPPISAPVPAQQPFGSFLALAAAMGALSLLTPCVFPMIPITVSYFTGHSGETRKHAASTALTYAVGIVLTFSAVGMLLAVLFGAAGVNQLAANPWVNLVVAAIFLGFAFSLFGAFFIQVPAGITNKLSLFSRNQESKRFLGALLMGCVFTLTSFTCTAPFVGTLLVMTAQGNWRWPLAGMLVFSSVFALPFFVLALIPQLLTQLPKSGGWLNSVKVVMGFLEIAAAMKFLSNADLVLRWGVFTRQAVLATWVGVGLLTVLYLLGVFRISEDTPVESLGPVRLTFVVIFLATIIGLFPGLFGRQLGEWESFLPPEVDSSHPSGETQTGTAKANASTGWILNDYEGALLKAKQENKPIFIDFTGYTCTNCRWMEANMFPRPEVNRMMNNFLRLRLYTDGDGEIYERQQKLQQDKFGTVALPLYVILNTDGSTAATFAGLTRDPDQFLAFLKKGQG